MTVRACLFDLDGTLFDHYHATAVAITELARRHNTPHQGNDAVDLWNELDEVYYPKAQRREISWFEQRRMRLSGFMPELTGATDEELDMFFAEFLELYRANWRGFDDALPAVDYCLNNDIVVGVLTNGELDAQVAKMKHIGIDTDQVPCFASSDLPAAKPDPRAYRVACAELGVAPGETIMFGDSEANDVDGALAAGLRAAWVNRRDRRAREDAPTVPDLSEISALIARYN